jgi:hypothetical protein
MHAESRTLRTDYQIATFVRYRGRCECCWALQRWKERLQTCQKLGTGVLMACAGVQDKEPSRGTPSEDKAG